MSKPEKPDRADKPVKTSTTSQWKKDLNQAGKVLQSLTNSLDKLENSLSEAETALTCDRSLREEILSLQGKITALREENQGIANELRNEITSWADVNLKLAR